MAVKEKNELNRKYLWLGVLAVITGMLALVLLVRGMGVSERPKGASEPETTWLPTELDETLPEETVLLPQRNPYGPMDFQYDGFYLTCIAGESHLGIDVSEHQQQIDWEQVAGSGVEYAMIRIGYRGFGQDGALHEDSRARENLEGAEQAGLDVGAYFFSQAVTPEEALEEALMVLDFLNGRPLDMPVVYDWEHVSAADARTNQVDPDTLMACVVTFCETIKRAGYEPMVYFNQSLAGTMLDLTKLESYDFWLAMYSDRMTYPYRVDMWQYTCEGTVPGIAVPVDLNLYLP